MFHVKMLLQIAPKVHVYCFTFVSWSDVLLFKKSLHLFPFASHAALRAHTNITDTTHMYRRVKNFQGKVYKLHFSPSVWANLQFLEIISCCETHDRRRCAWQQRSWLRFPLFIALFQLQCAAISPASGRVINFAKTIINSIKNWMWSWNTFFAQ